MKTGGGEMLKNNDIESLKGSGSSVTARITAQKNGQSQDPMRVQPWSYTPIVLTNASCIQLAWS